MARADFRKALPRAEEVRITVVGRSSGRRITLPVWFAADARALYLLPVTGSDSAWFRNLRKNRSIALAVKGSRWKARKVTLIRNRSRVRKIADLFREKYGAGQVRKYYSRFDVGVGIPLA